MRLVGGTGGPTRGGGTLVAAAANLQLRGPCLAEFLHHQPEMAITDFSVHNPANGVALGGPEMQNALVVLTRDRIFRLKQVEDNGAVFEYDGMPRATEELFEHPAQGFGGHIRIFR